MHWLGARELKQHTGAVIRRVQRGERFFVTHHGTPVAVLTPIDATALERLLAREADWAEALGWLEASAPAFAFWDNADDSVWDSVESAPVQWLGGHSSLSRSL